VIRRRLAPARLLLAAVFCLWGAGARAEAIGGDMIITRDMKPWEGCGECHDLDGVAPNGHFPNLAGQKTPYFLKQMEDFRLGRRSNDHGQMGVASRTTTGKPLDAVAAYFATLPSPPPQPSELSPADTARAQTLLAHGSRAEHIPACANCHALKPKHEVAAPCLEAQQAKYLAKQLDDFKAGRRKNDADAVMQKIAQRLSERDVDAVSAYLASLARPAPTASCAGERP
jgi:cytochrome c553